MPIQQPTFGRAVSDGEVLSRDGYHQPGGRRPFRGAPSCGCRLTTEKGAYRDVTVRMPGGDVVHFYHQTPVVVESGPYLLLSSGGYRTMTTKERINRHLPRGWYVRQEDFTWYLERPDDERITFNDGMVICPEHFGHEVVPYAEMLLDRNGEVTSTESKVNDGILWCEDCEAELLAP